MLKEILKIYLFGFTILVIASASFVSETLAQNSDVTARVTSVKGSATYSFEKIKNRSLKKGRSLGEGYEVRTGRNSRVVVSLSDGSQIVILSNTRLVFGDFEKASSLRELLRVSLGKVRIKVNKFKNKPNPYKVRTPTASIAVRGTEFEITVSANGETRVITTEGLVEVYSLKQPDESLFSEPGRGVIVRADFTLDFLNPTLSGNNNGNTSKRTVIESETQSSSVVSSGSQTAANVYERFSGNVSRSVENFTPSRFIAFSNPHFDSLENPAYAGTFDYAEGQVYYISGLSSELIEDNSPDSIASNADSFIPIDYNIGVQGSFFTPIPKTGLVIGGSGGYVLNGVQSIPVSRGEDSTNLPGSTTNQYYDGSVIVAYKFGSKDQTSVGFSYNFLKSQGLLLFGFNQADPKETPGNGSSGYSLDQKRFTAGIKHNFDKTELGIFYRYRTGTTYLGDATLRIGDSTANINAIKSEPTSSEIGFRIRRMVTPKFFYGVEGSLLFENSRDEVSTGTVFERIRSTQNTNSNRTSAGIGFGYLLKPQTIFSVDLNGGFVNGNSTRTKDSTGELTETNKRNSKFASFHAAVQTDIWKGLFGSASINNFYRSNALDQSIFTNNLLSSKNPFGTFANDIFTRNSANYTFSDFGLGWRFNPHYIVQYTFTTDYGKTTPRHNVLFRYSFSFGKD